MGQNKIANLCEVLACKFVFYYFSNKFIPVCMLRWRAPESREILALISESDCSATDGSTEESSVKTLVGHYNDLNLARVSAVMGPMIGMRQTLRPLGSL